MIKNTNELLKTIGINIEEVSLLPTTKETVKTHKLFLIDDDVNEAAKVTFFMHVTMGYSIEAAEKIVFLVSTLGKCCIKKDIYENIKIYHDTLLEYGLTVEIVEIN